MSIVVQAASVAALLLGMLLGMAGLSYIAKKFQWHPEFARKIVHIVATGVSIPLPWIFPELWPIWLLLALSLLAMVAMRTRLLAVSGRALHSVERDSWGDIFLLVSVGLLLLLYRGEPVLYVLPLLVLALGDAAAALTGSTYGKNFYTTADGRKSFEGSVMFFLITLILAMVSLLLLTEIGRLDVIIAALGIAIFATVIEADSWRGYDNLFLPMGVYLFLSHLVWAGEQGALVEISLPLFAMLMAFIVSRMLGLDGQVSRIYAAAIFMLVSASDLTNSLLPACVLLAHALISRRQLPDDAVSDTLNVVSGLALISFGFLALGNAFGLNAINFYLLACTSLTVGLVGHALNQIKKPIALSVVLLLTAAAFALWFYIVSANGLLNHWHRSLNEVAALIFVGTALLPLFGRWLFHKNAMFRMTWAAATPALLLYLLNYAWYSW